MARVPRAVGAKPHRCVIQITLPVSNGNFVTSGVSVNGTGATCSGSQAAQVGIQYSGYITTVSGQTYPFTVTATS